MSNRITTLVLLSITLLSVTSCSSVVEPIRLPYLNQNQSQQEDFKLDVTSLTFKTAQELSVQSYERLVSRSGQALSAGVTPESTYLTKQFPPDPEVFSYQIGIGDEINLIQYSDASPTLRDIPGGVLDLTGATGGGVQIATPIGLPGTGNAQNNHLVTTSSRVGTDGSILMLGVGRVEAAGRPISELRREVRSILIRNGQAPNFQLEISEFNSQKAYITSDSIIGGSDKSSLVLPITDQGLTLREFVAQAGVGLNEAVLTLIQMHRDGAVYQFSLADLFDAQAPSIYIKNKDHVFIKNLNYVPGKVFLVGGLNPIILPIRPEIRQTLAEVLFSPNGPMADQTAQRSGVYLLRGRDPIKAYHLDARNPARILVAEKVELRPNDIVFVGEQPINTFSRSLASILPLRVFSRDVQNNNLP